MNRSMGLMAAVMMGVGAAQAIEPGEDAPAFTLASAKGGEVSLEDYKGSIVVLEWLNYECPFVRKHYGSGNMPKLQETYTGKDVVWLSVNSSAEGKQGHLAPEALAARSEKEGNKATAVLLDTSGEVGKKYGAKTTPHMFVIDAEGKIAYAGGIDDKADTKTESIEGATNHVSAAVDALLAGKEVEVKKAPPYGCGVKY